MDDVHARKEALCILESPRPVVLVELSRVFALIAPPTIAGVTILNQVKNRLPGKYYGTVMGSVSKFIASAQQETLPDAFKKEPTELTFLEDSFIRLKVANRSISNPVISEGTHQALFLPGGHTRDFFVFLENHFLDKIGNIFSPNSKYSAVLCTSANLSGDTFGAITELETAREFAKNRNVELLIRSPDSNSQEKGSYPIFFFDGNHCSIERRGPGLSNIIQDFPSSIYLSN